MIFFIINAAKIIFLLGFLVLIHEGGHFLVARLCKVNVLEFSIGFGPTLYAKQGKQTKYSLRLIPLGGYVNLEGEEERVDKEGSFSKASITELVRCKVIKEICTFKEGKGFFNICFTLSATVQSCERLFSLSINRRVDATQNRSAVFLRPNTRILTTAALITPEFK